MASAKKAKKSVAKKSTVKSSARRKIAHRDSGTITSKIRAAYKAAGNDVGKARQALLKKNFNKYTVNRQLWLVSNGM